MKKIAVIGAGGWGTAVAIILAKKGHQVTLWARREEFCTELEAHRENTHYLPGVLLPANITITPSVAEAAQDKDVLVNATPVKAVRETAQAFKDFIVPDTIIVSLSKGLEPKSYLRCSQVLAEVAGHPNRVAVISGPNHAEEVARDIPTTTVASGNVMETAEAVQEIFMTPKFRVYTNPDIVGVEIAGALKNIIALAAGVCDGLGFGDNTKAALMTRGIAEITRLGIMLGAQPLTFAGLAGIGDLIATCTSKHSRNWRTGYALGRGKNIQDILSRSEMVVEGINTTETASILAQHYNTSMPITNALREVIFEGKAPQLAVMELMLRGKTNEREELSENTQ